MGLKQLLEARAIRGYVSDVASGKKGSVAMKVWAFLNGKKRIVALSIFLFELFAKALGHSAWADQAAWLANVVQFGSDQLPAGLSAADLSAGVIGIVGIWHAVQKAAAK